MNLRRIKDFTIHIINCKYKISNLLHVRVDWTYITVKRQKKMQRKRSYPITPDTGASSGLLRLHLEQAPVSRKNSLDTNQRKQSKNIVSFTPEKHFSFNLIYFLLLPRNVRANNINTK